MDENTSLQSSTPPKALTAKKEKEKPPETDVAVAPQNPMKTLSDMLNSDTVKEQIAMALPKHMKAERMIRIGRTAVQRSHALMECDIRSIVGAIVEASELGLEPNGVMGHAYLVPFRNNKAKPSRMEAQLMVGYKGLIDLARRSGKVTTINAEVVYAADKYEVTKGLYPNLIHEPSDLAERGEIIAAYATARIVGEPIPQFANLNKTEIDALRARSKAGKAGPWVTDYAWMAKKSAIRQLCKLLPCSVENEKKHTDPAFVIERDELREKSIIEGDDFVDVHAEPVTGLEKLADDLESGDQSDLPAGGK